MNIEVHNRGDAPYGFLELFYSETTRPCRTANFTIRKFHTVENWYQFLTAREKLVPIRHVLHTNISYFVKNAHVVKLYVAYMRILPIDKIPHKSAVFGIRFQFFTRMSLFYNRCGSNRSHVNFISFRVEISGTGFRIFKCKSII